jgi:hypothetical protein
MASLGWTLPLFVNVRRPLETLLRKVPDEIREAAIEILTRDGGAPITTVARRRGMVVEVSTDGDLTGGDVDPDLTNDAAAAAGKDAEELS